jgi:hypothetical protein
MVTGPVGDEIDTVGAEFTVNEATVEVDVK